MVNTLGELVQTSLWRRFWLKVVVDHHGCWIWVGARSKGRRGRRTGNIMDSDRATGRRWYKAHRLMLTWATGPAPAYDMEAGHRCPTGANSLCVNPSHLAWVTRVENEADKRVSAA